MSSSFVGRVYQSGVNFLGCSSGCRLTLPKKETSRILEIPSLVCLRTSEIGCDMVASFQAQPWVSFWSVNVDLALNVFEGLCPLKVRIS